MDKDQLRKFVNKIFAKRGYPPVKKFATEFADGQLFVLLFNLMYDEKIDCKLSDSVIFEDRVLNWSRINQLICFNYMQQRFYLMEPTMKTLAKGTNSDAIFKLIKVLIGTQQNDFEDAIQGDTTELLDVASEVDTEQSLFGDHDKMYMTDQRGQELYLTKNEERKYEVEMTSVREDEQGNKYKIGVPAYVQDQMKDWESKLTLSTGYRSAQFQSLLMEQNIEQRLDPASVKERIAQNRYQMGGNQDVQAPEISRQSTEQIEQNQKIEILASPQSSPDENLPSPQFMNASDKKLSDDIVPEVTIQEPIKVEQEEEKVEEPSEQNVVQEQAEQNAQVEQEEVDNSQNPLAQELKQAELELEEATAAQQIAKKALKKPIDKKYIADIKAQNKPPRIFESVFQVLCLLHGVKVKKAKDGKKHYFMPGKELLSNPQFMNSCYNYDPNNISNKVAKDINKILSQEDMSEKAVKQKSSSLVLLLKWTKTVMTLHQINKQVDALSTKVEECKQQLNA